MPSKAFETFVKSLNLSYEDWHEGVGYDLDALAKLSSDEQKKVEELLIAHDSMTWREIEALDRLGSTSAFKAIEAVLTSEDIDTRVVAAKALFRRKKLPSSALETIIVEALPQATLLNGMMRVLSLVRSHPTKLVRQTLLRCARYGNEDIRVHAAAMAAFVYRRATKEFDWKLRPLFLRMGETTLEERENGFAELCSLIGVDPATIEPF